MSRAAVVQDWFFPGGGSERVAVELARLLPDATVHTSFFDQGAWGEELDPSRVRAWPLQRLLGATPRYRSLFPLYPVWFSFLDLRKAELVVSSSSAFARAVRTGPRTLHVGYIHAPMRYAWDLDRYLAGGSLSAPARWSARTLAPFLRRWDRWAGSRPDVLVANSATVRDRIRRVWGRDAEVIHPPVDVESIEPSDRDDGFLLVVSRMLSYRRLDLAIEAATLMGRKLVVVGGGPDERRLRALAGPTVRFAGRVDRPAVVDLFRRCHAYVVPGEEDFGIAPVEAMAAGKPVVALRAGGATETVVDAVTGVFFDRPALDDLCGAIDRLDAGRWDRRVIRERAEVFSTRRFLTATRALLIRHGVDGALLSQDAHGA